MHYTAPPDVEWFGGWPCFHDSEILQLHINRGGISALRIDLIGTSEAERRSIVVFEFSSITSLHIHGNDADVQNVIAGLDIERTNSGYRLGWDSLFGMSGEIEVETLRVRLELQA